MTFGFNHHQFYHEVTFDFSMVSPDGYGKCIAKLSPALVDFCKLLARELVVNGLTFASVESPLKYTLVVTSAARTPQENEAVGGSKRSSHLRGHALDVRVLDGQMRRLLLVSLADCGCKRVGIGKGFIHFDVDASLPASWWTY